MPPHEPGTIATIVGDSSARTPDGNPIAPEYFAIPPAIRRALDLHATEGREAGAFVEAVLRNDFVDAVCRATPDALIAILAIAHYVYNELPGPCWGSADRVKAWRARFDKHEATGRE